MRIPSIATSAKGFSGYSQVYMYTQIGKTAKYLVLQEVWLQWRVREGVRLTRQEFEQLHRPLCSYVCVSVRLCVHIKST